MIDENARAGGSGLYQLAGDARQRSATQTLLDRAGAHASLELLAATCAAGYYTDHWVPLVDAGKLTKMRARAVVVASGAFEQPAVFRNNDLPGVMLASAAQRLIYRYAVQPMRRAVVLTGNGDGYRAALDLLAAGVQVAALVDLRPDADEPWLGPVRDRGVEVVRGACVVEAIPDPRTGALRVRSLTMERSRIIAGDRAMSSGLVVPGAVPFLRAESVTQSIASATAPA